MPVTYSQKGVQGTFLAGMAERVGFEPRVADPEMA